MMPKSTACIFFLFFLVGCTKELNQPQKVYLTSTEPDYLVIESFGKQQQLKLCGITVPKTQISEAKKLIESLVNPSEGLIVVWPMGFTNSALLAEVYAPVPGKADEEKSINGELLVRGLAQLSNAEKCSNREAFTTAQDEAKERRIGIWK
jgi:endonuclease YncB( thermonuclease family)